jgi:hypothetical protein
MAGSRSKYWVFLRVFLAVCSGPVTKDHFFVDTQVGSDRTLVNLLPSVGGDGSAYERRGFIHELREPDSSVAIMVVRILYGHHTDMFTIRSNLSALPLWCWQS